MTPGKYNLSIYRGDTHRWQFVLWADDAKTQPADLAGVIAEAEIRDKTAGTVRGVIECTITEPNVVDAVLDADASRALAIAKGVWDLQLTYPSGDVRTVLAGTVAVTGDVTDSTATA